MSEEQYKETFQYRYNELRIAWADFLCALFGGWDTAYKFAIQYRVDAITKAEEDYREYMESVEDEQE